jgi:hypothetical protein
VPNEEEENIKTLRSNKPNLQSVINSSINETHNKANNYLSNSNDDVTAKSVYKTANLTLSNYISDNKSKIDYKSPYNQGEGGKSTMQ